MTQNKSQVLAHGTIDAAFRHEERERVHELPWVPN
jgi:hypothetical protein